MKNIFKGRHEPKEKTLKFLHPYLYKRVRLKVFLFNALGLSLIFANFLDQTFAKRGNVSHLPNLLTGAIFCAIGTTIGLGLWVFTQKFYRLARFGLVAAFVYALFYLFLLLVTVVFGGHVSTASLVILWGYMTYNLFIIIGDTGWSGAALLNEIIVDEADKQTVRDEETRLEIENGKH